MKKIVESEWVKVGKGREGSELALKSVQSTKNVLRKENEPEAGVLAKDETTCSAGGCDGRETEENLRMGRKKIKEMTHGKHNKYEDKEGRKMIKKTKVTLKRKQIY